MSDLRDDLLPGDEDAILADLDKPSSIWPAHMTAEMIEAFKAQVLHHDTSSFADLYKQRPIMPLDDEPKKFRWFADTQPVLFRPQSVVGITSV